MKHWAYSFTISVSLPLAVAACKGDPVGELPSGKDDTNSVTTGPGGQTSGGGVGGQTSGGSETSEGMGGGGSPFINTTTSTGSSLGCTGLGCPPEILVPRGEKPATAITLDDTYVYYAQMDELWRVPQKGGTSTLVCALDNPNNDPGILIRNIVVDDKNVYFLRSDSAILKAPKSGGKTSVLVEQTGGATEKYSAIAQGGGYLYFTMYDAFIKQSAILKVSVDGGPKSVAVPNEEYGNPFGIALDATYLYWSDRYWGKIMRAPRAGGAPETLATAVGKPSFITLSASNVYFAEEGSGVNWVPRSGGKPSFLPHSTGVARVVVDATRAYWVDWDDQTLASAAVDTGTAIDFVLRYGVPTAVAADATHLYFTSGLRKNDGGEAPGAVLRLAK